MTLNVGNLVATLGMDTKGFSTGIAKAETGLTGMKTGFLNLKTVALASTAAIGAALIGVGAGALAAANSIDEAMATIRVGTGATGDDLEAMGDSLRTVLGQVPSDAATVGTAIAELNTRLGLTGDELEDVTIQFTELSRITGTDVKTNISKVTRLFGDFSVATEDQADALDYLYKVSQATGASVDTLASKATQYGTSLRAMGFDMGTSIALLGKFEKEGVNTETVLASLKIGMANMAREGVTDANEALTMLMQSVKDAPSDVDATAKSMEIFGSRAAADMAMAIREGRFEVDDLIDSVESSSETILDAAEDSMTLGDRFDLLKNKASLAIEPIGEGIIGALEGVMDWIDTDGATMFEPITGALASVGAWWDESGEGIFTSITDAIQWLQDAFHPFIDIYLNFWGNQAQKMTEFWNEDGALVMAALENIRLGFQTVIEYIAAAWEWLWPYLEVIVGPAVDVLLDIVGIFAALFAGDWDAMGEKLTDLTLDLMDVLWGILSLGFDAIMIGFEAFANAVLALMTSAWNLLLGSIEGMINKAVDMLNSLIKAMNEIPGVSIPLIGKVSFERAEAPTVTMPRMEDLTGGESPTENIREALGIEEGEEEELIPDTETQRQTPVEKALEDAAKAQEETAEAMAEPTPQPVEVVAPVPTEEPDRADTLVEQLASSGVTTTALNDIRTALWEIAENIRLLISEPIKVIPTMPEPQTGEMLAPEAPLTSIAPSVSKGTIEIPVMIDGYEVGRAVYTDWNRRTGGGLNI